VHDATLEILAPPAGRGTLIRVNFSQSSDFSSM